MQSSRRVCAAATLIGFGVLLSQGVSAQPDRTPPQAEAATVGASLATTSIESKQLHSLLGREVRTASEENAGRVIDALTDRSGRVDAVVIEFGGFLGLGTRKIAVEWSALRFVPDGAQGFLQVELTRDQLRRAPEYKPGEHTVVLTSGR